MFSRADCFYNFTLHVIAKLQRFFFSSPPFNELYGNRLFLLVAVQFVELPRVFLCFVTFLYVSVTFEREGNRVPFMYAWSLMLFCTRSNVILVFATYVKVSQRYNLRFSRSNRNSRPVWYDAKLKKTKGFIPKWTTWATSWVEHCVRWKMKKKNGHCIDQKLVFGDRNSVAR